MALGSWRTGSGKSITQILTDYGEDAVGPLGAALYQEASQIMAESQPLVPVDTGALRASGYVAEPMREGDMVRVELGYGGPAAKINPKSGESTDGYAIFVHQNLEAHHPVGQALYLEVPFLAATKGMAARIAERMKAAMRGGGAAAAEFSPEPEVGDDPATPGKGQ